MILQLIIYISLHISSFILISKYYTKHREPLNKHSSNRDKLIFGFIYGLIGACIMYVHKRLPGDIDDLRQLVVILSLFYGGWIPALTSTAIVSIFWVFFIPNLPISSYILSIVSTLLITKLVMISKIQKSKQWYIISVGVMAEICFDFWIRDDRVINAELLEFAVTFVLGSIFAYHFMEFHQHIFEINEELHRSKKELEISQTNYRLIAEHSTDLISVSDRNGLPIYLSPSHELILGIDVDEFRGRLFDLVHPDDYVLINPVWSNVITEKKPSQIEYRYQHANGKWVWIESHYVPIHNDHGEVEKIISISRDITDRKKTEEVIRDAEKLSIVGELAAGIAHEIRNPLTTLKGFIQMLKKESSNPYYLDVMFEELCRIEAITNELLYLGKPQAQSVKESNIEGILEQVTTLLHPQALMNNIVLKVQLQPNLPFILCVENQLKQVFINLLKNSIEAMPKGGEIQVESRLEKGFLLVSVKDSGIGISEERMETLGQPFYSLKEKGTGLGLTVCKKIIHEHAGSLIFHSKEGVGTIVEVRLPIWQL
ncbi:ATP-binding protein [Paenibacillus sp. GCM10027628]|uniref:ATP-binding protein n=1 Tax=Paenibacillus sp. GCM10027628 TaxID=3273413 RepID=UPI00362FB18D